MHVHSAFSDGQFTPEALAIQAIESGIAILGITDHYFTKKTPSIKPEMLVKYVDELDRVAEIYRNDLIILKAIEINTLEFFVMGMDLPPVSILNRLDYVLLEYITNIPRAGVPLQHAIRIAREIPIPCGLAHTDLAMAFPDLNPDELVKKLADADIFIELNESYCRPGERIPFYNHYLPYLHVAKDNNLKLSVGTDTHHKLNGPPMRAIRMLVSNKLENKLFFLA